MDEEKGGQEEEGGWRKLERKNSVSSRIEADVVGLGFFWLGFPAKDCFRRA